MIKVVWPELQSYEKIIEKMDYHVLEMQQEKADEAIWFLEHEPVYTLGSRTPLKDVQKVFGDTLGTIPIVHTPRGGMATYHGPGQRVIYCMIHLKKRGLSLHDYLHILENWMVKSLEHLTISTRKKPPHMGIWTSVGKIASFGLHVSRGITSHGIALNVTTDLNPFYHIVPCGLEEETMDSVSQHLPDCTLAMVDKVLWDFCPFFQTP